MRTYFEMGTDGHRFLLVDFEGTFGGYLYNCLFVRHVQMVASACQRSHPASLEVAESMLWLDHALTVKIKNLPFVGILHTSDEQAVVQIPCEGTFEIN